MHLRVERDDTDLPVREATLDDRPPHAAFLTIRNEHGFRARRATGVRSRHACRTHRGHHHDRGEVKPLTAPGPALAVELEIRDLDMRGPASARGRRLRQNQFRTPEYFWFSPNTLELVGWRLTDSEYKTIPASENAWYWSQELGLYLGVWEDKLRYFTVEGKLVPTPEEANLEEIKKAEFERQRAELERQRAESEHQRADDAENKAAILAQKFMELCIVSDIL